MPQIQRTEANKAELVNSENKPFRQRLMDLFKAQDFVRVRNIDDEDFQWQYMPTGGEEAFAGDDDTKITLGRPSFSEDYSSMHPGNETFWQVDAGKTEVLPGENAYVFIEGLYKRVAAKRITKKVKGRDYFDPEDPTKEVRKTRSFNWADVGTQKSIVEEIFLGIETPQFGGVEANAAPGRSATTTSK